MNALSVIPELSCMYTDCDGIKFTPVDELILLMVFLLLVLELDDNTVDDESYEDEYICIDDNNCCNFVDDDTFRLDEYDTYDEDSIVDESG